MHAARSGHCCGAVVADQLQGGAWPAGTKAMYAERAVQHYVTTPRFPAGACSAAPTVACPNAGACGKRVCSCQVAMGVGRGTLKVRWARSTAARMPPYGSPFASCPLGLERVSRRQRLVQTGAAGQSPGAAAKPQPPRRARGQHAVGASSMRMGSLSAQMHVSAGRVTPVLSNGTHAGGARGFHELQMTAVPSHEAEPLVALNDTCQGEKRRRGGRVFPGACRGVSATDRPL